MANTTVKGAVSVHGTNPQYLVEKVIRARVYESMYWKEECFALNPASLIDKAVKMNYVGGTYANQRPTEFVCLVLKLLQLQPEKEIIMEYLRAEEFKYLRALAAFYVRMTFDPLNVYETLEPLLDDYRKIRYRNMDGSYRITTIDEFADQLLVEERVCDIQLPRITQRAVLENTEGLPKRKSKLGRAMGVMDEDDELSDKGSDSENERGRERYVSRSPSASPSPSRMSEGEGEKEFWTDDEGNGERYVSRTPSPDGSERYVSRSPSPASDTIDTERIPGDV